MKHKIGRELVTSIIIFLIVMIKVVKLIINGECHAFDILVFMSSFLLVCYLMLSSGNLRNKRIVKFFNTNKFKT